MCFGYRYISLYISIHIHTYTYTHMPWETLSPGCGVSTIFWFLPWSQVHSPGQRRLHPVSITRFPLRRFSPGAGLLRNPFVHSKWLKIFQGLGPKRRESSNGDRVYRLCEELTGLAETRLAQNNMHYL